MPTPLTDRRYHGAGGLRTFVEDYFRPELGRIRGLSTPIESAFLGQTLTPGALYGAASTAATGMASQLFAPGGEVQTLIRGARGRAIGQGFDPSAAEGNERAIVQSGVNRVSDTFAQQAGQLESLRYSALSGAFGDTQAGIRDLIESIFTGLGSAEQLHAANRANSSRFLGLF